MDIPAMASIKCSQCSLPHCWMDYDIVCHMAGLAACLDELDQASLQRLFSLAAWDANYFLSSGRTIVATGPVSLMYAIYNRPGFPATLPLGVTLPTLSADQSTQLDIGQMPMNLATQLEAVKGTLGLMQRP
jgi:hypothetical protein